VKYKDIAITIIKLKNDDLSFRNKLIEEGTLGDGYDKDMEKMHNKNAGILDEIIDRIGYPTIDKVGAEANEAAWLVIQHAIGKPAFMKKCLILLKDAVNNRKANPKQLAYLSDRIAVFEGKPQLYGTQFDWTKDGVLGPNHFDDLSKVNQRRQSIGLITLEEQTEIIQNRAETENETPPAEDFTKRRDEYDKWRKLVGWIK